MPVTRVTFADQLDGKVAELEAAGQQIVQIVPRGEGWVIVYRKGPGRPPAGKETRG